MLYLQMNIFLIKVVIFKIHLKKNQIKYDMILFHLVIELILALNKFVYIFYVLNFENSKLTIVI